MSVGYNLHNDSHPMRQSVSDNKGSPPKHRDLKRKDWTTAEDTTNSEKYILYNGHFDIQDRGDAPLLLP